MPILDRQKRGYQIGEIRTGYEVKPPQGKSYPTKLETFRLTTVSRTAADSIAAQFGGEVQATVLKNGKKTYEVFTEASELPVMVPPGDSVISQWYEMWSAAGRARQCDGFTEQRSGDPCKCPSDLIRRAELAKSGSACRPVTRLNVMLPDVPDLGVWLLTSNGGNAADELEDKAEMLRSARDAGVILPAKLRLEPREVRIVGEKPCQFVVPVLEISQSLRQLMELGSSSQDLASALPPPPPQAMSALASGHPYSDDDEPIEAELLDAPSGSGWLSALYAELDAESRDALMSRIKKANFPDPPPAAVERQVRRWVEEIRTEKAKGAPFE
jgi:hypothetical protein